MLIPFYLIALGTGLIVVGSLWAMALGVFVGR